MTVELSNRAGIAACLGGAAWFAAAAAAPAHVHACSCAPDPIAVAQPEDGATDVPIDIAPVLQGALDPESVAFAREDGAPVEFELRAGTGIDLCAGITVELRPAAALEPNTTYVIAASSSFAGEGNREIRFTTGARAVPEDDLEAPAAVLSFVRGNLIGDSCTSDVRGCLTVEGDSQVELRVLHGDDESIWTIVRGTVELNTLREGVPDCVELRARDAAARRSPVTRLCSGDFGVRDTVESDYEGYQLRCEHGVIGDGLEPVADAGAGDGGAPITAPLTDSGAPHEAGHGASRDGGERDADEASSGTRSELDMSDGGCSAARHARGGGALLLSSLALFALRRRSRHPNV